MAMACPMRKKIVRAKQKLAKKKETDRELKTNAEVVEISKEDQRQNSVRIQIGNTTSMQISTCILHVYFININFINIMRR